MTEGSAQLRKLNRIRSLNERKREARTLASWAD